MRIPAYPDGESGSIRTLNRNIRTLVDWFDFRVFVRICLKLKLYNKELIAIDGSKFRAVNSKDNAYNAEILNMKLNRIDGHIAEYLSRMDIEDATEPDPNAPTTDQVKAALRELAKRKEKYQGYLKELEESGETQLLITDPEARRMLWVRDLHLSIA